MYNSKWIILISSLFSDSVTKSVTLDITSITTLRNILDRVKIEMANMENPHYRAPAKYLSDNKTRMKLVMSRCKNHSLEEIAHQLKVPLPTLKAWIWNVETKKTRLLREGRVVRPSRVDCHFCRFSRIEEDESKNSPKGSFTFGLLHNICQKLIYNPWGGEGYPEETLMQEKLEKDCGLTVVFNHQYCPYLCLEDLTSD